MILNFDELMKQEEMISENLRKADDRYMETLRQRAFPTPSPFGVEWEKQRVIEAYTLIARWSQGRKVTPTISRSSETRRCGSCWLCSRACDHGPNHLFPSHPNPFPLR
jgi:hypothetical protein